MEGFIPQLQEKIQEHTIDFPVYVLQIEGAEIILGAAWLATFSPHMTYSTMSLQFFHNGQFITLKGDQQCKP